MIATRTEQVISVHDWDDLVVKTYGRPYCFQQQDGCKERQRVHITIPTGGYDLDNDTVPEKVNGNEMGVSFAAWLKRDPKAPLADGRNDYGIELWCSQRFNFSRFLREAARMTDGFRSR